MLEIWRTAIYKGEVYEGFKVSNLGKILSLNYRNTGKSELLTPGTNTGGYFQVKLSKKQKRKNVFSPSYCCRDFLGKSR